MARPDRLPKVLTEEEAQSFLETFNDRYPCPARNRALVHLALGTGLRASELLHLEHAHLSLEDRRLVVREGKGAKDRTLWFRPEVRESLEGWFHHEEAHPLEGLVFTTLDGGPLSSRYLRAMVGRHARKAGVSEAERVSPHVLRHTFATRLYAETSNLRLVQKSLGHSSIQTTEVYTHIYDHELRAALRGETEAA